MNKSKIMQRENRSQRASFSLEESDSTFHRTTPRRSDASLNTSLEILINAELVDQTRTMSLKSLDDVDAIGAFGLSEKHQSPLPTSDRPMKKKTLSDLREESNV
mmetsp:Transcript_2172/g.3129  ORF Transcript_2172/g.3129 Transcript_2172/m.3129 type:complete len:104 (+) Transcript_2172:134-445(+)